MARHNKPSFNPKYPEKNAVVSDTQDSFRHGAIREEYWGRSTREEFREGVKLLENFDILEQNTLAKRTGAKEDGRFKEFAHIGDYVSLTDIDITRNNFQLHSDQSGLTHYVEKVTVKDFKVELFAKSFLLAVCWRTENFFTDDMTAQTNIELTEKEGVFSRVRNDIHIYAGRLADLEVFRPLDGGFFFTIFQPSVVVPDSPTKGIDSRTTLAVNDVAITRHLSPFGSVVGFTEIYFKGGEDLSTADMSLKSVRGGRDFLVVAPFAYPVAVTNDGEGWSARWLGFPGLTVFTERPKAFSGVPGGTRFVPETSKFKAKYYEWGFQPGYFSREGIRVVNRAARTGTQTGVYSELKIPDRDDALDALPSNVLDNFLTSNNVAITDVATLKALAATLPAWAGQQANEYFWQDFSEMVGTPYVTTMDNNFPFARSSGGAESFLRTATGLLIDGSDLRFQLKGSLEDTQPRVPDMVGFSSKSPGISGRAKPLLISELGDEGNDNSGSNDIYNRGSASVAAIMDEEIYRNCIFDETLQAGYLLIYTEGENNAGQYYLCEVKRYLGYERFCSEVRETENYPNVILTFFTRNFIKSANGYEDIAHLGFETLTGMLSTLNADPLRFTQYALPGFSVGRGFPSSVTKVDSRVILGGFGNGRIMFGAIGSSAAPTFGFSGLRPLGKEIIGSGASAMERNFSLSADQIELVREGKADTVSRPNVAASADMVFYYNLQLNSAASPFEEEPDIGTLGNQVRWVDTIRDLLVGSAVEETRVRTPQNGPLAPGLLDFRGFQSARGSGSHLTAKGDYSLFFVGPEGNEIFYFWYDDAISGLRTRSATVMGGKLGTIKDIRWDYRRKALWVIHGEGEISLFFLSKEYGIMGWSEYKFDGEYNVPTKPERGVALTESRYRAVGLYHRPDRSVGFSTEGGKLVYLPFDRGEDEKDYFDAGGNPVISRVEFFRNPPQSRSGPATIWKKRQGVCDLLCRRVTELFSGGSARDEFRKALTSTLQAKRAGLEMYEYSLQGKETSVLMDEKLLFVSVEHHRNERAEILSVSGRYEIKEL